MSEEIKRNCPICQKEMKQKSLDCVTVDICMEHGIWPDIGL